jgi:catechol 2,3-dioxygenase-like lactoylglutathione lyase family enzyme
MQEIDHFTYEVANLGAVEQFYAEVLDLPLHKRHGPEFDGHSRHTFYWLKGHSIGFFPEAELKGTRDPQGSVQGSPLFWAYEVSEKEFDAVMRKLDSLKLNYSGPIQEPKDWPIAKSVRFSDSDGFCLEAAVRR